MSDSYRGQVLFGLGLTGAPLMTEVQYLPKATGFCVFKTKNAPRWGAFM